MPNWCPRKHEHEADENDKKKHPRIQNSIKRCRLKKTQDETKVNKREKKKNLNNPTRKLRRLSGLNDKAEE